VKDFEVRKSSSQVMLSRGLSQDFFPGCSFFLRKVDDLFLVVALKILAANAADCFTVKMKQINRSRMVTFLFSVHFLFTLLPKQSNRQGAARAANLPVPASSFDLARPGVAPPPQRERILQSDEASGHNSGLLTV